MGGFLDAAWINDPDLVANEYDKVLYSKPGIASDTKPEKLFAKIFVERERRT